MSEELPAAAAKPAKFPYRRVERQYAKAFREPGKPAKDKLQEELKDYYRLDVSHDIRREDLPTFFDGGGELIDIIEATQDLKLLCSGWQAEGDIVKIFNYWALTDGVRSLVDAELQLPDDPSFLRFDRLMLAEQKDLVLPVTPKAIELPQVFMGPSVFVRVTYQVPSKLLAEFVARLQGNLKRFAKRNNWYLGDAYLGLTGTAGQIIQTWVAPEASAPFAEQIVCTSHWQAVLPARPTCRVLRPLTSCPMLGHQRSIRTTLPSK